MPTFPRRLVPRLFECLAGYRRADFAADAIAGMTVGLIALPLAMAFAISSGVKPEAGIYTAIVAGFVVSALGGSRFQVAGPTGAFVVIVAGIGSKFGLSGLLTCTAMAGAILLLMGVTRLGGTVRFIPRAVTIGFTNGIAVLIASTQIKDFFGLTLAETPSEFLPRMQALGENFGSLKLPSVAMAGAALAILLIWPRLTRRIPGSIVALALTTGLAVATAAPVETIGSKFGGIPSGLPRVHVPEFRADLMIQLLPSALAVALLAAIESLLSAVVADNLGGDKHKPDAELAAQGIANLLAPLVGGIPATGAIARTAANIRSGAKSPVAGMVHAATLLLILLAGASLAQYIPLPTLAALLLVVAWNMGEWREIPSILRLPTADRLVWLTTFLLTVVADLTVAVQVGMALAAILYIRQVTRTTSVVPVTAEELEKGKPHVMQDKPVPAYVSILRIYGPFLFGVTEKLDDAAAELNGFGPIVILNLRNMTAIDGTGVHALEEFAQRLPETGRRLLLCGARSEPARLVMGSALPRIVGAENILPHFDAALARARELAGGFDGLGQEMAQEAAVAID